jgi:hypothetical protein
MSIILIFHCTSLSHRKQPAKLLTHWHFGLVGTIFLRQLLWITPIFNGPMTIYWHWQIPDYAWRITATYMLFWYDFLCIRWLFCRQDRYSFLVADTLGSCTDLIGWLAWLEPGHGCSLMNSPSALIYSRSGTISQGKSHNVLLSKHTHNNYTLVNCYAIKCRIQHGYKILWGHIVEFLGTFRRWWV